MCLCVSETERGKETIGERERVCECVIVCVCVCVRENVCVCVLERDHSHVHQLLSVVITIHQVELPQRTKYFFIFLDSCQIKRIDAEKGGGGGREKQ